MIFGRLREKIQYLRDRDRVLADVPSLADARMALTDQKEYWAMQRRSVDPFFSEEPGEAERAIEDALAALDRLQEAGYPTGIREVEQVMSRRWSEERKIVPQTSGSY